MVAVTGRGRRGVARRLGLRAGGLCNNIEFDFDEAGSMKVYHSPFGVQNESMDFR